MKKHAEDKIAPSTLYSALYAAIQNFTFPPSPSGKPFNLFQIISYSISRESGFTVLAGEPGDIGILMAIQPMFGGNSPCLATFCENFTRTYIELAMAKHPNRFTDEEGYQRKTLPEAIAAHSKAEDDIHSWVKTHMQKLNCGAEGIEQRYALLKQEFNNAVRLATEALLGQGL